jgi:hypothetical protein
MLVRSRQIGAAVAGALLAGGILFGAESATAQSGAKVTLAVPAYFNDEALWTKVINTPQVGYVIGHPVTPADGKYVAEKVLADRLAAAKAKGKTVLIYVTAGYDKVAWQTVADRVDSALAAYPSVDGVFLDEILYNECDKYKSLSAGQGTTKGIKARNPGKLVVLNPGAPILNCYEGTADAYLNLERSDASVKEWVDNVNIAGNVPFYQWMFKSENRNRIWQMVHTVTPANLNASIDAALGRNASVLFITPDALPNPYDSLPDDAAWKTITERVDAYNAGRVALPTVVVPTVPTKKTTTKKTTTKR